MSTLGERAKYQGQILSKGTDGKVRPVSSSKDGDLRVDIVSNADNAGRNTFNGIFGEQLVAHRNPYVSASFYYPVNTESIINKSTSTGYFEYQDNLLAIRKGTAVDGVGYLRTRDIIRYRAGRDAEGMFTAIFDIPTETKQQRAGIFTENDGFAIGYNGLEFGVFLKNAGNEIFFSQDEFNFDNLDGTGASEFNINTRNINIFRINYGYLGIAPIIFEVYTGIQYGWVTFHVIDLVNQQNHTHIDSPYLPAAAYISNDGSTEDSELLFGSIYIGGFNGASDNYPDSTSREFSGRVETLTATGLNAEEVLFVAHNKDLFAGKKNYIKSILLNLSVSVIGTKPVTISIKKLKTEPTGGIWEDIDDGNAVIELSIDAAVTQTQIDNASIMLSRELSKEDSRDIDATNLNLNLYPNEYVIFVAQSANETDVVVSIRESERF